MSVKDITVGRIDSRMMGAAGEHYVMAELLRRGFIAALAPAGAPNMDIIVSDRFGASLAAIQVKTTGRGDANDWMFSERHEGIRSDRLFYALVNFGATFSSTPQVFVLPASLVADACETSHRIWLSIPKKTKLGTPKGGSVRRLMDDYGRLLAGSVEKHRFVAGWLEPYRNAWGLLGVAAEVSAA